MKISSVPLSRILAAATCALFPPALAVSAQVFTDLRPFDLAEVVTVNTTPGGPVVFGRSQPPVRWTPSSGGSTVNVPPLSPMGFQLEDVSSDGSVFVGRGSGSSERFRPSAYRWESGGNLQELTPNIRDDLFRTRSRVSDDGSVVAGFGASSGFRWDQDNGHVPIGAKLDGVDVIGPDNLIFKIGDLSNDGSVMVGTGLLGPFDRGVAVRWTEATGIERLGEYIEELGFIDASEATAVSSDGSIVVGTGVLGESPSFAFRWTEATGMQLIGDPLGTDGPAFASAMSADGSVIVGGLGLGLFESDPFVWTAESGMQRLVDILTNEYGIGDDIAGWDFGRITALSRDGRYIAGQGTSPDNVRANWLVDLGGGFTPVPEPATYGVIGAAGLLALTFLRRRKNNSEPSPAK